MCVLNLSALFPRDDLDAVDFSLIMMVYISFSFVLTSFVGLFSSGIVSSINSSSPPLPSFLPNPYLHMYLSPTPHSLLLPSRDSNSHQPLFPTPLRVPSHLYSHPLETILNVQHFYGITFSMHTYVRTHIYKYTILPSLPFLLVYGFFL